MHTPRSTGRSRIGRLLSSAALVLCALTVVQQPARAFASDDMYGPPARIDNIYGGFDHQPTESEVRQRERAAGIDRDGRERQRNAAVVDRLYQELEGKPPAGAVADR